MSAVQANPLLWSQTAIIVTFDEGGGYYDPVMFSRSTTSATAPGFQ